MKIGNRLPLALLFAAAASQAAAASSSERVRTAPASPSALKTEQGKAQSLNFNFGDFRASLTPRGLVSARGQVRHRGLICATYSVEMRFGAGKPGCTNPEWISRRMLVSEREQCNDAVAEHRGGDTDPGLEPGYERVTCAELVIRCRGNCK